MSELIAIIPKFPFVKVGCDPEFFLKANGRFISAVPLFEGNKDNPKPLLSTDGKELGTVIHDNVAVEFTMPPSTSKYQFAERVADIREAIISQAKKIKGQNVHIDLDCGGSHMFSKDSLNHPETQKFGCDPDFSAWDYGAQNNAPEPEKVGSLRAAGGHIHVGYLEGASERVEKFLKDDWGKIVFVQLLDMTVGQLVADLERTNKKNIIRHVRRRTMYGAAGAYRPKPYGVEYRSPSSAWCSTRFFPETVFNAVQMTAAMVDRSENPDKLADALLEKFDLKEEEVRASINTCRPIKSLLNFVRTAKEEVNL